VAEVEVPGGSVDYFLVSVNKGRVVDFVGIELQALDTTGTLWPACQGFLDSVGVPTSDAVEVAGSYGINWKMTAKTTLVQLHHKVETFEGLGKHLVLVLQDSLMEYMRRAFNFGHIQEAQPGHAMHFHQYTTGAQTNGYPISLTHQSSTDAAGIAKALGLQGSAIVELDVILAQLQGKLSARTRLTL
jgi:hypothetical protein